MVNIESNLAVINYIIKRGGKFVAYIRPLREANIARPLEELKSILKELPRLDDDLEPFAADLESLRGHQPSLSEEDLWE